MTVKNIKLREHQQRWFNTIPVGVPQHMQNRVRQLHRLAGYLADSHNRQELYSFIEEYQQELLPLMVSIDDQLKKGD